jgi:hypothetical protein
LAFSFQHPKSFHPVHFRYKAALPRRAATDQIVQLSELAGRIVPGDEAIHHPMNQRNRPLVEY